MKHDVVIVGAGPVGLVLAVELATAGVRPLVLERLATPDRTIKAFGLGAVGTEALRRRGFGPAIETEHGAFLATMMPVMKARAGAVPSRNTAATSRGCFWSIRTSSATPSARAAPCPRRSSSPC